MKRFLPLLCLLPLLLTADILLSQSALNDVTAMAKAKAIWGTSAAIGRFRVFGAVNWTFQVGCVITGGNGAFIVAGTSPLSWDAAFTAVDMSANGPHVLSVTATANDGQTATDSIPVFACNPPGAPALPPTVK
jgi:hypothetical protein